MAQDIRIRCSIKIRYLDRTMFANQGCGLTIMHVSIGGTTKSVWLHIYKCLVINCPIVNHSINGAFYFDGANVGLEKVCKLFPASILRRQLKQYRKEDACEESKQPSVFEHIHKIGDGHCHENWHKSTQKLEYHSSDDSAPTDFGLCSVTSEQHQVDIVHHAEDY